MECKSVWWWWWCVLITSRGNSCTEYGAPSGGGVWISVDTPRHSIIRKFFLFHPSIKESSSGLFTTMKPQNRVIYFAVVLRGGVI